MPAGTPTEAGKELFDGLKRQIDQINAWIRQFSADSGWVEATLENGYTNLGAAYGDVAYRKIGQVVYLKGGVSLTGRTTATRAFILPEGFQPKYQQYPALGEEGNVANKASCFILTNGEVIMAFDKAENNVVYTGISFPVN